MANINCRVKIRNDIPGADEGLMDAVDRALEAGERPNADAIVKKAIGIHARQLLAQTRLISEVKDKIALDVARGKRPRITEKLLNMIENDYAYHANSYNALEGGIRSAENVALGRYQSEIAKVVDLPTYNSLLNGNKNSQQLADDISREIAQLNTPDGIRNFGYTKNESAVSIARVIHNNIDHYKKSLKSVGIEISDLEAWARKQKHNREAVKEKGQSGWIEDIYNNYLGKEKTFEGITDGVEQKRILGEIWNTVALGSDSNLSTRSSFYPGLRDIGRTLKKERYLIFQDVEKELAYNAVYNKGESVISQGQDLVMRYAKDFEIASRFGLDPQDTITKVSNHFANLYPDQQLRIGKNFTPLDGNGNGKKIIDSFNVVTGRNDMPMNNRLAKINSAIRSFEAITKIGGTPLDVIIDQGQFITNDMLEGVSGTARKATKIFFQRLFGSKKLNREARLDALAVGVGLDGSKNEYAKYILGQSSKGFIGSVSDKFSKWSGLNAIVNIGEEANAQVIAHRIASDASGSYKLISKARQSSYNAYGINESNWPLLQKYVSRAEDGNRYIDLSAHSKITDQEISDYITQQNNKLGLKNSKITNDDILSFRQKFHNQVANMQINHGFMGINKTSAKTKRQITLGTKRGTGAGEFIRNIGQFKTFSWNFHNNYIMRLLRNPAFDVYGKAKIGAISFAGFYLAGHARYMFYDLLQGKTPRDPSTYQANVDALSRGITTMYSDPVLSLFGIGKTRFAASREIAGLFSGPAYGDLFSTAETLIDTGKRLFSDDKEVNQYRLARAIKGKIPGQNIWYADGVINAGLNLLRTPEQEDRADSIMEEYSGKLLEQKRWLDFKKLTK